MCNRAIVVFSETRHANMSTTKLFWSITWRATVCGAAIAAAVQALFGALLAAFATAAAMTNRGTELFSPGIAIAVLAGIFMLWLIGAVAGGLFSVPAGILVGVSGGILVGILTRLFFHPVKDARRYRGVMGIVMGGYAFAASWVCFMAVYLLFARDNELQSPLVPRLALIPALIAGGLGYLVSGWIARWYERATAS